MDSTNNLLLILLGIAGIAVTLYLFGGELPLYILLAAAGFLLYIYSPHQGIKIIGVTIGTIFVALFIVGLIYYLMKDHFSLLILCFQIH